MVEVTSYLSTSNTVLVQSYVQSTKKIIIATKRLGTLRYLFVPYVINPFLPATSSILL